MSLPFGSSKKYGVLIIATSLMILMGCNNGANGKSDEQIANEYVADQNYEIIASDGEIFSYTLQQSSLSFSSENTPIIEMWSVQQVEPDEYFGKEISIYRFTVKNHPLEEIYNTDTIVCIMLSNSTILGGYSIPDNNGGGWYSSLDGKTLEDITGLSYEQWLETWKDRYG